MDQLASYLPPAEGLLPKWLLLLSAVSIGNSIQAYLTLSYTRRVYNNPTPSASQATPLSSRTFGTYTGLASIVRLYAAYHITEKAWFEIAFWTYVVAGWHFGSEWLVFRTAKMGEGLVGPIVISTVTMVWMWLQWGFYVG
ncbi:ergosterol 28 [Lophiostoma macrostomum CBS 122681]|uniref:Ergosterol 28 n=1 Tax=Lophiostoma macrostomum CBS 122681 TaxID=1314788 RepID=A0A6A6TSZ8_9PLEO|nr:ergosterol 28 [Lophiostoma macrostomum CBS 122681]